MLCCVGVALSAGCTAQDPASTLLRWKFRSGQKLRVCASRSAGVGTISTTANVADATESVIHAMFDVTTVDHLGTAQVDASVERIQLKVQSPHGTITIDSDAPEERQAKEHLSQWRAVKEAIRTLKIHFVIDNRGRVVAVKTDENAHKRLGLAMPDSLDRLSEEGLKRTLRQIFPVFPESPLAIGDTWSDSLELNCSRNDPCGKVSITYRYAGRSRDQNADVEKIVTDATLEYDPNATRDGVPFRIAEQENSGVILFDNVNGQQMIQNNSEMRIVHHGAGDAVIWEHVDVVSSIEIREVQGSSRKSEGGEKGEEGSGAKGMKTEHR
jgi:hypothetical protein